MFCEKYQSSLISAIECTLTEQKVTSDPSFENNIWWMKGGYAILLNSVTINYKVFIPYMHYSGMPADLEDVHLNW